MAIIENHTPRTDMKKALGPAVVINDSVTFETEKIEVVNWKEHYFLEVKLKTDTRKVSVRLGHHDLKEIVKQYMDLQEVNNPILCMNCQEISCECK